MKARSSILVLLVLATLVTGQSWQKKDYRQWSEYDCRKLVTDSPWSQTYMISEVLIEPLANPSTERAREANPRIEYLVQFRSAYPVRRAMVRLAQINAKYDQLTADQRKQFDERTQKFLAVTNSDTAIVDVTYNSNVQVADRELARQWNSQTTQTLSNSVFLIGSGGVKVPLSGFVKGEGAAREFQFVFPRQYQGQPVVTAKDKTLAIEFMHPQVQDQAPQRVYVAFKIEKMIVNGELIY